jgi:flagellar biosynthesis/type III secretory pathway protein FliH
MSEQPFITQETFQEIPYSDQSWEVIGNPPTEQVFQPMEVQVVGSTALFLDPMFRDYGGRPPTDAITRWHLPEDLASIQESQRGTEIEQEVDTSIRIQPEEIEQIKAQAYQEGLAAGKAEEEGRQQQVMQEIGGSLQVLLSEFKGQTENDIKRIEEGAVALALSVSRKIVGHAVEINPEYIVQIIRESLKMAKGATVKRVRVSPQDHEFIQVVGLEAEFKGAEVGWRFEADPTVQSGCIVDSSAGEIDYQLDKAWERIQDAVLKVVR